MIALIGKIVLSAAVAFLVYALCVLLGGLLIDAHAPFLSTIGAWLKNFAPVFGLIAGVFYFFRGPVPAALSA